MVCAQSGPSAMSVCLSVWEKLRCVCACMCVSLPSCPPAATERIRLGIGLSVINTPRPVAITNLAIRPLILACRTLWNAATACSSGADAAQVMLKNVIELQALKVNPDLDSCPFQRTPAMSGAMGGYDEPDQHVKEEEKEEYGDVVLPASPPPSAPPAFKSSTHTMQTRQQASKTAIFNKHSGLEQPGQIGAQPDAWESHLCNSILQKKKKRLRKNCTWQPSLCILRWQPRRDSVAEDEEEAEAMDAGEEEVKEEADEEVSMDKALNIPTPVIDELYDDMMPTLENDTPLDETQRLNPAMSPESENCQPEIGLPVLSSTPQKPHLSPGVQKTSSAGQTPCSSVPISPSSGQTSSAGQTSPSSGLGHSRPLPSSPFTQNDSCNTESPLPNRGNCNCNCNCNCENVAARLQQLEHTISSYVPTTVRNMLINITLFIKPVKCSFQAVSKLKSTELDKIIYELKTLQSNVHKHVVVHQQKVLKKKTEFLPANGSFSMGHGELMGYLMGYLCPIVLTNMTRDQVTSADCWAGGKKYRILVGDHKTMSSFGQAAVCLNKTEFQWVKKAAFGHCCLRGEENEYVFHTVLGRNILKPSLPPYGLAERWIDRVSQFQPDPEQCLYAGK
ncbi:hypothetical protein PAMA_022012 [Pampus argenteus]